MMPGPGITSKMHFVWHNNAWKWELLLIMNVAGHWESDSGTTYWIYCCRYHQDRYRRWLWVIWLLPLDLSDFKGKSKVWNPSVMCVLYEKKNIKVKFLLCRMFKVQTKWLLEELKSYLSAVKRKHCYSTSTDEKLQTNYIPEFIFYLFVQICPYAWINLYMGAPAAIEDSA